MSASSAVGVGIVEISSMFWWSREVDVDESLKRFPLLNSYVGIDISCGTWKCISQVEVRGWRQPCLTYTIIFPTSKKRGERNHCPSNHDAAVRNSVYYLDIFYLPYPTPNNWSRTKATPESISIETIIHRPATSTSTIYYAIWNTLQFSTMNNMMLAQLLQDMQVRSTKTTANLYCGWGTTATILCCVAAVACGAAGRRDAYRADGYGGRGDTETEGIVVDSCVRGLFDMYLLYLMHAILCQIRTGGKIGKQWLRCWRRRLTMVEKNNMKYDRDVCNTSPFYHRLTITHLTLAS